MRQTAAFWIPVDQSQKCQAGRPSAALRAREVPGGRELDACVDGGAGLVGERRWRLPVGRESGSVQVDAVTADGNPFLAQKFELSRSDRRATVAAHDTMPRHIGRTAAGACGPPVLGKDAPDKAWGAWFDVFVGAYEPGGSRVPGR